MPEAVLVSTLRTPIGKAFRGAFNRTAGVELIAPVLAESVRRVDLDPADVDEVVMGCGYPEGATGGNIARAAALRASFPVACPGLTISRFCASGLEAIAHAARRIQTGEVQVMAAGGVESISLVQPHTNRMHLQNEWLRVHAAGIYATMIETADTVAERYGIRRSEQDEFAALSHQKAALAWQEGRMNGEILPIEVTKQVRRDDGDGILAEPVTATRDEGIRPNTDRHVLAGLEPVRPGQFVTAGNASQLSDGASVCILMSSTQAERRGLRPLAAFRGLASAGCEPDEMGIGPVVAVPKLLKRFGLGISDIDLWELNEAFASQAIHCRDRLGIPSDRLNVNGGAIALGHPYGMTGSRLVGHISLEARRRGARYGVVTMCVAGGMGCAALLEFR